MRNYTKTQQRLIERAKLYGGLAAVDVGSGRGALGGRITFGNRERAALQKLVDMGLVEITNRVKDVDYNRGNSIHSTTIVYRLTPQLPSDDQFLATLGPCGR
jgi:hypothetical protein